MHIKFDDKEPGNETQVPEDSSELDQTSESDESPKAEPTPKAQNEVAFGEAQDGSVTRPTLFMVVPLKENFNLLIGREWIHRIGVVPSSMHQKVVIWRDDGSIESIEAYQSYFLAEVDNITRIGSVLTSSFL
ncbi:hypothetical protein MTR_0273s0050 [Medicago truncatula]|uniref:Uncharacterized protein n=1 Tax=Medicago truncatula TaxID=3880 RepID=A0A072TF92_MEDTR|nr:hypothetical protein MTR_0273s0050 [Medicago truncatula]